MLQIGGHLSIAGGFTNALNKTIEVGGNALQIFASSPRIWSPLVVSNDAIEQFVSLKQQLKFDSIYFHASYLINLADPAFIGQRSRQRILEELELAEKMEIKGTIIHLGSYKLPRHSGADEGARLLDKRGDEQNEESRIKNGLWSSQSDEKYQILLKNISWVLEQSHASSYFIIENAGNRKIGWNIDEIAKIISDLKDDRLRVCLDTCHMHAAGYDISTPQTFTTFFDNFENKIGLNRLEVFQVNDSKDPLGSFRDRHENIGDGTIPSSTFTLLLNEEITKNIPFILEVPGVEKKGPNKEQVDKLKSFSQLLDNASA